MKKSLSFLSILLGASIFAQVDVTATTGTATATYTTVKAAFDAINTGTHQGVINITLTANTSETATAVLNRSTGTSNFTSIVMKPASGVTATITNNASSAGQVLRILGSNVTIDGSNNGTDSRNLSIINGHTSGSQGVAVGSADSANPVTNVTIKNTTIINAIKSAGYGILVSNGTGTTAGYFNNIILENNSIQKAYQGIYVIGTVLGGNGTGTVITKNDLYTSGDNSIRYMGIYVAGTQGVTVSNNKIGNFENTFAETKRGIWLAVGTEQTTVSDNTIDNIGYQGAGTSTGATGIQIFTNSTGASGVAANKIIRNKISNLYTNGATGSALGISLGGNTLGTVISDNVITNLTNTQTSASTYGAEAIILGATTTTSNTLVSNNFISKISSFATNGVSNIYTGGIYIYNGGGGYKIYNNSVYLAETQNNGTNKGVPIPLSINSIVTPGAIDLRNNIFVTNQDSSITTYAAAIYFSSTFSAVSPSVIFSNIDNNIFYSTNNYGYISIAANATLATTLPTYSDFKTSFGGNANSLNVLPKFISDTDLHIIQDNQNLTIDNKGIFVSDVTTDIDGETRSTSTPDIGADEFTIVTLAVSDVSNKSKIKIYPNPVSDVLTVSSDKKVDQIAVYNVAGQIIKAVNNSNIVDVTKLSSGVYFVKTVVEGKTEMTKIIKK